MLLPRLHEFFETNVIPIHVSDPSAEVTVTADVSNLRNQSVLVQVIALDGSDSMGFESMAPVRDFFLGGAGGTTEYTS